MQIIFVHGTSLSSRKAHWVQIMNTAWAMAHQPHVNVHVVSRTHDDAIASAVMKDMGLSPLDNFHLIPSVPLKWYRRLGLKGDMLVPQQKPFGRMLARRTMARLFRAVAKPREETIIVTRNQDLPPVCPHILDHYQPLVLNEHHKFEYQKILEGKLKKKRPGRRTLSEFKHYARNLRAGELAKLERFDGIICTTDAISERLAEFRFSKPTAVIPNAARVMPEETTAINKDIDILYIGQLYRWKNVDLLVEALSLMADRKLTIVGGDREDDFGRLRALAKEHRVENRVQFLGHQPHAAVKSFMRRARVGVIPLPRRGFPEARSFTCPLKAIEMMAAGTPFVATRLRSVEGLLEDGRNAVLVAPDNAEALARGIERLLDDEALRRRVIEGGYATARELTYDARAKRILDFAGELKGVRKL